MSKKSKKKKRLHSSYQIIIVPPAFIKALTSVRPIKHVGQKLLVLVPVNKHIAKLKNKNKPFFMSLNRIQTVIFYIVLYMPDAGLNPDFPFL